MNQNTPNPRVALKSSYPCSLPIELGSIGYPSNANLQFSGGTGHPGLAAGNDGDERSHPPLKTLCLILEEST